MTALCHHAELLRLLQIASGHVAAMAVIGQPLDPSSPAIALLRAALDDIPIPPPSGVRLLARRQEARRARLRVIDGTTPGDAA